MHSKNVVTASLEPDATVFHFRRKPTKMLIEEHINVGMELMDRRYLFAVHQFTTHSHIDSECAIFQVNKAFWRSCSLMLGAVIEEAFKDQYYVQLHSFPSPNGKSAIHRRTLNLPQA